MSTFGNELSNVILMKCENEKESGASVKDILDALKDVLAFIIEYWL